MAEDQDPTTEPVVDEYANLRKAIESEREMRKVAEAKFAEATKGLDGVGDLESKLKATEQKLASAQLGVKDEKVEELVTRRLGQKIEDHQKTLEAKDRKLKELGKDLAKKSEAMKSFQLTNQAQSVLLQAKKNGDSELPGVRPDAIEFALSAVGKYFEPSGDGLRLKDPDADPLLRDEVGNPVTLEGFRDRFLREKHPFMFPARGGSGATSTSTAQTSQTGKFSLEEVEKMTQPEYEKARAEGRI